ncbi:hypothetical protein [Winogradskyella luteola]|uniref:Uncharacterized protein n=1 Tax=Winogradskyella luteola TaxID=2828330 RepID=A0A9X1JR30_9FLAO|nr:hypothetical protein [Winogradskyella luteola]MBV7268207.1 hypothetical protein [Winogradskyella luteola]
MGLGPDIIIFITAILFGIFLYWRESNGNGAYRFVNKMMNSKELQMSADNPKGFIYKQPFIPRLLFIVFFLLVIGLILQFLTPIEVFTNYFALSGFATFATGTLIGTYLANFVIKTTEVVEEKSDSIGDMVEGAVEKGKDFIEDLKNKDNKAVEVAKEEIKNDPEPEVDKKSARDRLKDKGLM